MSPAEAIRAAALRLQATGVADARVDAALLLAHVTGGQALALRLDTDTVLGEAALADFEALISRRMTREPLQYILEEQPFFGRSFQVSPAVLIPRPETELLCERTLRRIAALSAPAVLDLCCGSGCIGVSLALERLDACVTACDLSEDALALARSNAERLGAKVRFAQGDLFAAIGDARFDAIVSNPPYIPSRDCAELQAEVRREPLLALDGGSDGLDFYRRIVRDAPEHLRQGAWLLLEVGIGEAEAVCDLCRAAGFTQAQAYEDYNGILRMVEAR